MNKKASVVQGKGVDVHSRLIYLLVAFGLVTVLVVIGCFGCSNENPPMGEVNALVQLQKLGGTEWTADAAQPTVDVEGSAIERLRFGNVPDADMNLDVTVFCAGNPVGESWVLHGNAHGLSVTTGTGGVLAVQYSASSDGLTETFSITNADNRKAYFRKGTAR
ncbi:MAG: hypothetical protein SPD11_14270 [Sphaerochaetaceae bacterium]|nr:hypothetical protein [Sphaerochaetaceae bacterium]